MVNKDQKVHIAVQKGSSKQLNLQVNKPLKMKCFTFSKHFLKKTYFMGSSKTSDQSFLPVT
jgi:hypothetical protein